MGSPKSLADLRARIRELEGGQVHRQRVSSGIDFLDGLVRGLPSPGMTELNGERGSGRTQLALAIAAVRTQRGERVAWVDMERTLFPPAAQALGVDLDRLLIVRPSTDRAAWTVEQLARSGCFPLVIAADPLPGRWLGPRWDRATETGQCALVVISKRPLRGLPAAVRLSIGRGHVTVVRDRQGAQGQSGLLPPLGERCSPWL